MGIVASLVWQGYGRYDKWLYSAFARSERQFGGWTQQLAVVVAAAVGSLLKIIFFDYAN